MIFIKALKPLMLFALCAALFSCENPFAARTPEEPKGTGSRYIPPFSAEIVVENLHNAISDRNVENTQNSVREVKKVDTPFLKKLDRARKKFAQPSRGRTLLPRFCIESGRPRSL